MEKCTPSLVNNVRGSFINTHSIYNRNDGSSFMIVFLIWEHIRFAQRDWFAHVTILEINYCST